MDTKTRPSIDPALLLSLDGAHTIGTVTARRDPWPRARETATLIARSIGARLAILDRSAESRAVDPYGVGPMTADTGDLYPREGLMEPAELRRLGREELAACIEKARVRGVNCAGWPQRGVGVRALDKFARRFRLDALVLPQTVGWSLRARLRGEAPARLRRLAERLILLLVDEETGTVQVAGRAGPVLSSTRASLTASPKVASAA